MDSIETDTHVYIATERVRPLQSVLRDTDLKGKAKEEWIGWGVKSISVSDPHLGCTDNRPQSPS